MVPLVPHRTFESALESLLGSNLQTLLNLISVVQLVLQEEGTQ